MSFLVIRRDKGRQTIRLDYTGGPYIEMTFGSSAYRPTEVINVWAYDNTNRPSPPFDRWEEMTPKERTVALKVELEDWIISNVEEGWEDWYDGYIENARYA